MNTITSTLPSSFKKCSTCHHLRTRDYFWKRTDAPDGLEYTCKVCVNARKRRACKGKEFNEARRDTKWAGHLKRNFGITVEEYDAMLERQGGVCAICNNPETKTTADRIENLSVDHCHQSGSIRGLLCRSCNRSTGQLGDTVEAVRRVLNYLIKAEGEYEY